MRQITYALVLSVLAASTAWGQDAGPRPLSTNEPGIAPVVNRPTVPESQAPVDRQGRIRGTSVTDRLGEIRRRAVDADISRPFSVTDETDQDLIELHGALPAVPRRTVEKTASASGSSRLSAKQNQPAVTALPATQTQPGRNLPDPFETTEFPTAEETNLEPQEAPFTVAKRQLPLEMDAMPTANSATQPQLNPFPPLSDDDISSGNVSSGNVSDGDISDGDDQPRESFDSNESISGESANDASYGDGSYSDKSYSDAATADGLSASGRSETELTDNSNVEAPTDLDSEPFETHDVAPARPIPVAVETREMVRNDNILLSNQVPALSFETAGPRQIRIGREAKYRVSMMNRGNADARDVIVKVHLPAWAEVARTNATVGSPQVELDRDRSFVVSWELGQLTMNGKEDLTLGIIPRDSRPFDLSVGWTLAAAQSTTQIEVQEPKLEMAVNGSRDVLYGETSIYTIVLSNPGTGDAENVTLSLMPLTPHQDIAGTRTIGTLKAGERKSIELELTAHQAGQLQVRAIANAEGGLRADASQDVLVRRANLDVAIIGPPRNFAGTEATYKVRIENTGDATAEQAAASAVVPATAQYVSSNDGGKFDAANNRVQWHVGTLRPGAVRVLEFRCILEAAGENRIDISAMAEGDVQLTKSVVTQVEALADLKLFVNDPKGPVSVGQDSIYEVKIVNRGTKTAENINVTGYFSDGIEPLDIRGWRGAISTGQVQFEPITSLSAGQELVFRITARANKPGNHVFRAEIECTEPETRLATEEWTKYYGSGAGEVRQAARPTSPRRQPSSGQTELASPDGTDQPQGQFYLPEIRR